MPNVFANDVSVMLKVVNNSISYATFKKGESIGQAESAELVHNNAEHFDISKTTQTGAEQTGIEIQKLPEHLEKIYLDNLLDLSEKDKLQSKELFTKY